MPKKTKREKLLAHQHRSKLTPVATQIREHTPAITNQYTLTLSTQPRASLLETHESNASYHRIKGDLTKTVILTMVVLVIEFLLSRWLLNR